MLFVSCIIIVKYLYLVLEYEFFSHCNAVHFTLMYEHHSKFGTYQKITQLG
jgi:hypothetical protein